MIILQTTVAGQDKSSSQTNNSVFFEIQLHENIKEIPYIVIENHLIDEPELKGEEDRIIKPYKNKGCVYFFDLRNIEGPSYFSMVIDKEGDRSYFLKDYHYEPGDNVEIRVARDTEMQEYDLDFSGIGAGKYRCITELKYRQSHFGEEEMPVFTSEGAYNMNNNYTRNMDMLNDAVEKYQPEISDYSYALLRADIVAEHEKMLVAAFYQRMHSALTDDDQQSYLKAAKSYRLHFQSLLGEEISDQIKFDSKEFAEYMLERLVTDYLEKYTRVNFISIYNAIRKIDSAALSDKVLVHLFLKHSMNMKDDYRMLIDVALKSIQSPVCKRALGILADYGPASIL